VGAGDRVDRLQLKLPGSRTSSTAPFSEGSWGNVTVPKTVRLVLGTGTERLNSADLNNQGFSSGPKVGLICHGDSGYELEFSFFEINGWSTSGAVNPQGELPDWLVFVAPGNFVQTTDYPYQSMAWAYATKLHNAEWNVRWDLCPRVTMLAGFRWVNLWENLDGTIVPSDRASPFWKTTTHNNLYGVQLGEDWKILSRGPFSFSGLVKAGLFDNVARESTGVSIYRTVYWESAATNHVAFLGECGLQAAYQANEHLLLKAGYEAIWLQGLALAPAQIPDTLSHGTPPTDVYVQALGIHCNSGVLFHGLTLGVEYSF
jgi:hypothetical protein